MNKIISVFSLVTILTVLYSPVNAAEISKGGISGKSVLAGVLSLIIWTGIGQAVNDEPGKKVVTHLAVGLIPPFRFWSAYDALVDRHGGYWEGKV